MMTIQTPQREELMPSVNAFSSLSKIVLFALLISGPVAAELPAQQISESDAVIRAALIHAIAEWDSRNASRRPATRIVYAARAIEAGLTAPPDFPGLEPPVLRGWSEPREADRVARITRESGAIATAADRIPSEVGTVWIATSDPVIAGDQAKLLLEFRYISPQSGRPDGTDRIILLSWTPNGWTVERVMKIGAA